MFSTPPSPPNCQRESAVPPVMIIKVWSSEDTLSRLEQLGLVHTMGSQLADQ